MSRFGNIPVLIPEAVTVLVADSSVEVKGPKGTLTHPIPAGVKVSVKDNQVLVERKNEKKLSVALQGTTKSHINNMVKGVTDEWQKELELVGSGYRAELKGRDLVLNVGYSHPIEIVAPQGITFKIEKSKISVTGMNKQAVGQVAAIIREKRKPDPYRAKGIKYVDEIVRRKAGKQAAKTA